MLVVDPILAEVQNYLFLVVPNYLLLVNLVVQNLLGVQIFLVVNLVLQNFFVVAVDFCGPCGIILSKDGKGCDIFI